MTPKNNVTTQRDQSVSFAKPVLIGAAIGLILISLFLLGAGEPNPAWGKFWMIKPLVMVPLAGAVGGVFYYFMDHLRYTGKLNRTVAVLLSIAVYIIGLWMGTVLGLDGTMWD